MSRASGTDRASRSSFGTTSVSPARTAAQCLIEAGALAFGAADAVVDVDAIRRNAERVKRLALSREVLLVSRASGVSNQCFIHPRTVPRPVAMIIGERPKAARHVRRISPNLLSGYEPAIRPADVPLSDAGRLVDVECFAPSIKVAGAARRNQPHVLGHEQGVGNQDESEPQADLPPTATKHRQCDQSHPSDRRRHHAQLEEETIPPLARFSGHCVRKTRASRLTPPSRTVVRGQVDRPAERPEQHRPQGKRPGQHNPRHPPLDARRRRCRRFAHIQLCAPCTRSPQSRTSPGSFLRQHPTGHPPCRTASSGSSNAVCLTLQTVSVRT